MNYCDIFQSSTHYIHHTMHLNTPEFVSLCVDCDRETQDAIRVVISTVNMVPQLFLSPQLVEHWALHHHLQQGYKGRNKGNKSRDNKYKHT